MRVVIICSYDNLAAFQSNDLEMYNDTYREIVVLKRFSFGFIVESNQEWRNDKNQLKYIYSKPSVEYCFHLINQMAIMINQRGISQISKSEFMHFRPNNQDDYLCGLNDDPNEIIKDLSRQPA